MKKTVLASFIFVFLLLGLTSYSQTQVSLQLVDNTGAFINGLTSDNIKFRRSPYTGGDVVSGLTVTQPVGNLIGNYIVTGFSTFEEVKLFVNDVEQAWFGVKYAGNLPAYIVGVLADYVTIGTNQTITGTKAFSAPQTTFVTGVFSGSVIVDGTLFEAVDPYINANGDPYLLYQHSQNSLTSVRLNDSLYGRKVWYADGDKMRMLATANKWYGRTNTISPFEINTDQFQWSSDKLNLNPSFFSNDSIKTKIITSGKDSTWLVLGEPVSKWRFLSLKKGFWANSLNIPDWKWYYESYSETGVLNARDSFAVINNIYSTDNNNVITLGTSATKLDSLLLAPGVYSVSYGINYRFVDASFGGAPTIQPDSLGMSLVVGSSSPADYIYATQQYFADVNYGRLGSLTWTSQVTITAPGYIYLLGIRQNMETGSGHTTRRSYITATLVR